MIVRKSTEADLPRIMAIIGEAKRFMAGLGIDQWQDAYPAESNILHDIRNGHGYVCEQDGKIAALWAQIVGVEPTYSVIDGAWHTDGEYITVHRIAIADEFRHSGLAAQIMDSVVAEARRQGCAAVRVDTHRGNIAMRRFLTKYGFAECGLINVIVTQGDPVRVAYDLPLAEGVSRS